MLGPADRAGPRAMRCAARSGSGRSSGRPRRRGTTRVWPGCERVDRRNATQRSSRQTNAPGELAVDDAGEERGHGRILWSVARRRRADPGQADRSSVAGSTRWPAGPRAPSATDRILTVPNVITLVRLACLPVFLWLLFGRDDRAGGRGSSLALWAPPTWSTATSPATSTRSPTSARCSTRSPTGCCSSSASAASSIDGSVPAVVRDRRAGPGGRSSPSPRSSSPPWAPAHRRHLVGQGRHLLPDGGVPAVPRRRDQPRAAPTPRVAGLGGRHPRPRAQLLRRAALYIPLGLRALREGRADRGERSTPPRG